MGIPEDPSPKPRTCFVYGPNPLAFRTITAWDPIGEKYNDILIKKDTEVHPLSHLAEWVRCKLTTVTPQVHDRRGPHRRRSRKRYVHARVVESWPFAR
jgi:hypothetical protein